MVRAAAPVGGHAGRPAARELRRRVDDDGETIHFDETPVLLFCRDEGEGYVYCGELSYLGHDPTRIPIRFVWKLDDYDRIKDAAPFKSLIANCHNLLQSPMAR